MSVNADLTDLLNLAADPPLPARMDVEPTRVAIPEAQLAPAIKVADHEPTAENDFAFVRENMLALMKKGSDMFEDAHQIMQESESARSVEVAVSLLKALSEMNKDLLELHVKKRLIKAPLPSTPNPGQGEGSSGGNNISIDKAVFVGSTADLQKMIKGKVTPPPEQE